jgi:hypothetical protein
MWYKCEGFLSAFLSEILLIPILPSMIFSKALQERRGEGLLPNASGGAGFEEEGAERLDPSSFQRR